VGHSNARLTPRGRQILIEKIASGRPVAHVAKEMGISRTTAWRWWRRWQAEGADGLADRSSAATSHPRRIPAEVEDKILRTRAEHRRGAEWIAHQMGLPPSTVGKVLARHNVPLLRAVDPLTGELTKARRATNRRYEHKYPGSLVHVDVKKLGRIPDGGGWRVHGRDNAPRGPRVGYDFIHVMIDDYSRVVYAEILSDERGPTCAAFILRAGSWFKSLGVNIERVITDNHFSYRRSLDFGHAVTSIGAKQKFIQPRHPWTNGKVERFNRTMAQEWAYARPYQSNQERAAAFATWLGHYNHERKHGGIGWAAPATRLGFAAPCTSGTRQQPAE